MDEIRPTWSPDGKFIAFARLTGNGAVMYKKETSAAGREEALEQNATPVDWSTDGRHILFLKRADLQLAQSDVWVFDVEKGNARPFLTTTSHENAAALSPDGRWVAYASRETGDFEVYVTAFPNPGGRRHVSLHGGGSVVWTKSGRELLFIAPDGSVMSAAVDGTGAEFKVGEITQLFQARTRPAGYSLDATNEGQRFLLNSLIEDSFAEPITLVVNWPQLLKANNH
jgi:Tol biopolymer transport system component